MLFVASLSFRLRSERIFALIKLLQKRNGFVASNATDDIKRITANYSGYVENASQTAESFVAGPVDGARDAQLLHSGGAHDARLDGNVQRCRAHYLEAIRSYLIMVERRHIRVEMDVGPRRAIEFYTEFLLFLSLPLDMLILGWRRKPSSYR